MADVKLCVALVMLAVLELIPATVCTAASASHTPIHRALVHSLIWVSIHFRLRITATCIM
jgi:hypothetical protein